MGDIVTLTHVIALRLRSRRAKFLQLEAYYFFRQGLAERSHCGAAYYINVHA